MELQVLAKGLTMKMKGTKPGNVQSGNGAFDMSCYLDFGRASRLHARWPRMAALCSWFAPPNSTGCSSGAEDIAQYSALPSPSARPALLSLTF
mmetsp:Transcript_70237/g.187156  ORF Transcript_70237/g.187156 Transcript_70237/m.187156 type:complete len:93 (-) Transcript_70237:115-393(-)